MISVCIIITGQMIYSKKNVESFQKSYLETLQMKCQKLGGFLKDDIEYVLSLNIPFAKLAKLENTLREILDVIPELEFIEITDHEGHVLYYASHESVTHIEAGSTLLSSSDKEAALRIQRLGLKLDEVETLLSVFHKREDQHVGYIKMRLSPQVIVSKSREILWDMITVILTSLLITFEMLTFFVSYSITDPLERMVKEVEGAVRSLSPLSGKGFLFVNELADVIERFNYYVGRFSKNLGPFISVQQFFPDSREKLNASIQRQTEDIESLLSLQSPIAAVQKRPGLKAALEQAHRHLAALKERMDVFANLISRLRYSAVSSDPAVKEKKKETRIPYSYIRPLIFLFIMANSFSNSFFPIYADTFYEPLWGLSREVIIGLPLSLYMFFLAITMPFAGSWADRIGWHKPLMISILFNAAGLILTAMSQNISQLLGFYSITAIGFAVLVISSQQFVIDNTTARDRTLGLAAFIAAFFSGDICGTVVGGMLANRIGYRNVFLVSGLIALSAFICGLIIFKKELRKTGEKKKIRARFSLRDVFRVLRDRDFFAVVFLQAIPAKLVLIGFLYYFTPLYLKRIGALQSDIGRVLMCYGVMLIFLSPLFSKFLDRESYRKYYIFAGGMITGLSMMSFYFYSGFIPILVIVAMIGLAHTFSVSSQASFITETAIVKKMGAGTGMGLFRFWERVGNVAGPLLMGFLIANAGYEQSVAVLGLISFVSSILYLIIIIRRREKPGFS